MKKVIACFVIVFVLFAPQFVLAQEAADSVDESQKEKSSVDVADAAPQGVVPQSVVPQGTGGGHSKSKKSGISSTATAASVTLVSDTTIDESEILPDEGVVNETEISEPKTIHLQVETQDGTILDENLTVNPCPNTPAGDTETVNIFCALNQSGLEATWSWWEDFAFLESLGGVANDFETGTYWFWFSNLDFGQGALNMHELTDGEDILLTFGIFPLKLSVSETRPEIGEMVLADVTEFGFDSNWNPVWTSAIASMLNVGDRSIPTDNGHGEFTVSSDRSFRIFAEKPGFLATRFVTINPVVVPVPSQRTSQSNRSRTAETAVVPTPTPAPERIPILVAGDPLQKLSANNVISPTDGSFFAPGSQFINPEGQLASSLFAQSKVPTIYLVLGIALFAIISVLYFSRFKAPKFITRLTIW